MQCSCEFPPYILQVFCRVDGCIIGGFVPCHDGEGADLRRATTDDK